MPNSLVLAEDLTFGFDAAAPLWTDLCFDIPATGVTLVQGGESRGKSTLLKLLAGKLQPAAGTLRMHQRAMQDAALAPHIYAHDPRDAAWNDVSPRAFWAQMAQVYPRFDDAKAQAMAQHLQLSEHIDKAMFMLSTGSKRKVSWVAALSCGADLLLMDEPFAALDLSTIRKLHQLLGEWPEHHHSAWVLADYQAPGAVPLAALINLGD